MFVIALLSLHACNSQPVAYSCNDQNRLYLFSLLKLQVIPTFQQPRSYEVTEPIEFPGEKKIPAYLVINTYEGQGGYEWGEIEHTQKIPLSKQQYSEVISLLDKALGFPKKGYSVGTDGGVWTLESSLYQYTATSFWSPTYQTEKRELNDIVALKKYLGELADQNI